MGAFDRSDMTSDGNFVLTELESTGEAGETRLELALESDVAAIAVLIEGDGLDAVTEIDGERGGIEEAQAARDRGPHRRLMVRVGQGMKSLRITIWSTGARARVSILRVFRRFRSEIGQRLSCTACKRLVRFLITSIITGFGWADLPWDGELPRSLWEKLRHVLNTDVSQWPPIVANLLAALNSRLVEELIVALRWLIGFLNEALQPLDYLLELICRKLGFCPKVATA